MRLSTRRTRRRHLLALGIAREVVHGYAQSQGVSVRPVGFAATRWRMVGNSIVQRALTNRWLHEQGVPDMRTSWIILHYGSNARV